MYYYIFLCRCGCNNLVSSSLNISQLERFFCPYWPPPCRSYTCPAPATSPPAVHYIHGWGDKTARLEDRASNIHSRRFYIYGGLPRAFSWLI